MAPAALPICCGAGCWLSGLQEVLASTRLRKSVQSLRMDPASPPPPQTTLSSRGQELVPSKTAVSALPGVEHHQGGWFHRHEPTTNLCGRSLVHLQSAIQNRGTADCCGLAADVGTLSSLEVAAVTVLWLALGSRCGCRCPTWRWATTEAKAPHVGPWTAGRKTAGTPSDPVRTILSHGHDQGPHPRPRYLCSVLDPLPEPH